MDYDSSSIEEEIIPLKEPFESLDDDDSVMDELERMEREENALEEQNESHDSDDTGSEESDGISADSRSNVSRDDNDMDMETEPDHDVADTYRPTSGEDIYGNKIENFLGNRLVTPKIQEKFSLNLPEKLEVLVGSC